jgi:hypothetical protein
MCRTSKEQTTKDILVYLAGNPDARDTMEGIVEWWLLEQGILNRTMEVREALAELVGKKLILEHTGRDARSHYRINRHKAREIRSLLKQESS